MTWMVGYGEGDLNSRASFFLILCKLVKVGLAQSSTPRGEATRRRSNFRDRRWGLAGAEADRGGQQSRAVVAHSAPIHELTCHDGSLLVCGTHAVIISLNAVKNGISAARPIEASPR